MRRPLLIAKAPRRLQPSLPAHAPGSTPARRRGSTTLSIRDCHPGDRIALNLPTTDDAEEYEGLIKAGGWRTDRAFIG